MLRELRGVISAKPKLAKLFDEAAKEQRVTTDSPHPHSAVSEGSHSTAAVLSPVTVTEGGAVGVRAGALGANSTASNVDEGVGSGRDDRKRSMPDDDAVDNDSVARRVSQGNGGTLLTAAATHSDDVGLGNAHDNAALTAVAPLRSSSSDSGGSAKDVGLPVPPPPPQQQQQQQQPPAPLRTDSSSCPACGKKPKSPFKSKACGHVCCYSCWLGAREKGGSLCPNAACRVRFHKKDMEKVYFAA
jgi:hypothetical protein